MGITKRAYMPHFENIDQYEAKGPGAKKRRIIPIAPHSLQATDYRPDRSRKPAAAATRKPAYPEVDIEPISVKQMEKEYRQASRAENRRRKDRGFGALFKRFRRWLASLLSKGKAPAKKASRRKGPANGKGRSAKAGGSRRQATSKDGAQDSAPRTRDSRRGPRGKSPRGPRGPKGKAPQKDTAPAKGPPGEAAGDAKKSGQRKRRNRRPRNRQQGDGQQKNNSGNQNPPSSKDAS